MSSLKDKFLYYCIPLRLLIAIIIFLLPERYLQYSIYPVMLGILGFIFRYIEFFINKNSTGAFGQPIWWNNNRLVHIILLCLFVFLVLKKNNLSRIVFFVDLIIGMSLYISYYV